MKIHFLMRNLVVFLLIQNSLLGNDIPKGYKYIKCVIKPQARKATRLSHPHLPGPNKIYKGKKSAQLTSTNWGGYVAASNLRRPARNSVSSVFGSWIVPSIEAANNHTYCAIWVGIDGYKSSTVEQIGTAHDWSSGSPQHYAWFEMYPGSSFRINGFPLAVGDVISASVEYSGKGIFTMHLYNDTQKVVVKIPTSYTKSTTAQRKSAEWIVEAPYLNGILPLSNFATAYLWGGTATIRGVNKSIGKLANASLEMIASNGSTKAMPSVLLQDKGSFFVTWQHQ